MADGWVFWELGEIMSAVTEAEAGRSSRVRENERVYILCLN